MHCYYCFSLIDHGIKLEVMNIKEVNPKNLKGDEVEQTLWYRGDAGDLFIIFTENKITHFEVTIDEKHLEGGLGKSMRFGIVDPDEHIKDAMQFKRSRMLRFEEQIPKGFVDQCIEVVFKSENLETSMKEGIMTFLSSNGSDDRGLSLTEGRYESFREIVPPPFDFIGFFMRWWKTGFGLILLGLIGTFVFNYSQKGKLEKACKEGNTVACANLGLMNTIKGEGNPNKVWIDTVSKNRKETKAACDKGDMKACYQYTDDMIQMRKLDTKALDALHTKACEQNIARGCYALAKEAYFRGDLKDSIKLFDKACASNFKDSCEYVLEEKQYVYNVEQCDNGDKEACYKAALKEIEDGKNKIADERLQKICDVGYAPSCTKLADLSARNRQVGRAQGLYLKACKMNDLQSCYNYRFMTAKNGEEKKLAKELLKACQSGKEESCLKLKSLE